MKKGKNPGRGNVADDPPDKKNENSVRIIIKKPKKEKLKKTLVLTVCSLSLLKPQKEQKKKIKPKNDRNISSPFKFIFFSVSLFLLST